MSHDVDTNEDGDLRRLLDELPRTTPVLPSEADALVDQLHREGLLRSRRFTLPWYATAAAAVLIFALGVYVGGTRARRGSLEDMLERKDLTVADRVYVLQRAGSAYVKAAQSYADATAHVDSSAIEVASKVLMGAAQAMARNNLDAGLNARLSSALTPVPALKKPIIWF